MHPTSPVVSVALAGALAVGVGAPLWGATPPLGTAELTIAAESDAVLVRLVAPAASLIGFAGKPRTADQRETLALAVQNLKTGDGLFRFNTQAFCRLEDARVDGDPKPAKGQAADLGASYRFVCDRPDAVSSVAVALFLGFPALEQVLVHYTMVRGRGEAVLTPRNPVVSLIPLR
jgi:hypothetical protein